MIKNARKPAVILQQIRESVHSEWALRLLICVLGTALLVMLFEVTIVPRRYNLQVGSVPPSTIAASKDVQDELGTAQKRAEAAAQVTPTYRYQEGVTEAVMEDFDQIFAQLRAVRQYGATLHDPSPTRIYSKEAVAVIVREICCTDACLVMACCESFIFSLILKLEP